MKRSILIALFGGIVMYVTMIVIAFLPLLWLMDRAPWSAPLVTVFGLLAATLLGFLASDFLEKMTRPKTLLTKAPANVIWIQPSRATFHVGNTVRFESDPLGFETPWGLPKSWYMQ